MNPQKPLINILIRTSARPNYFQKCIKSIYEQNYSNWNIIIGIDDDKSFDYVKNEKALIIKYNFDNHEIPIKSNDSYGYGLPCKYNLYFNELHKYVKKGYILYLDDDTKLCNNNSLKIISKYLEYEDTLIFWRVRFPTPLPYGRLVPSNENFGKEPVLNDIDTTGFVFHSKYKTNWEPYRKGDFRLAYNLYHIIKNKIFINKILTQSQRLDGGGLGRKDDLKLM